MSWKTSSKRRKKSHKKYNANPEMGGAYVYKNPEDHLALDPCPDRRPWTGSERKRWMITLRGGRTGYWLPLFLGYQLGKK